MTPRVGGLQLGVSFTPNNADRNGGENNAGVSAEANQDDIIELGLSYKGRVRGVDYKLSYTSVEGSSTEGGDDPESTSSGFALSYGDWSFGGNLSEYENLDEVDDTRYVNSETIETVNYGLKYRLNKASHIGIGFTEGEETHDDAGRTKTEYEETTIGGGTKLTDGVRVGYYYTMSEATHGDAEDAEGEVSALGMTLALKF